MKRRRFKTIPPWLRRLPRKYRHPRRLPAFFAGDIEAVPEPDPLLVLFNKDLGDQITNRRDTIIAELSKWSQNYENALHNLMRQAFNKSSQQPPPETKTPHEVLKLLEPSIKKFNRLWHLLYSTEPEDIKVDKIKYEFSDEWIEGVTIFKDGRETSMNSYEILKRFGFDIDINFPHTYKYDEVRDYFIAQGVGELLLIPDGSDNLCHLYIKSQIRPCIPQKLEPPVNADKILQALELLKEQGKIPEQMLNKAFASYLVTPREYDKSFPFI